MTDLAKALRELNVCASEALAYGGISGARYAALNSAIGGAREALEAALREALEEARHENKSHQANG